MKITKVTIQNLNSIRGKYTIDFMKNFSNHGIFLITGDTGSGKTTILDAITIALYSETPRLKSKHDIEQLISIGEKESLAEVEFIVDKKLYKSSWSIGVARTGKVKDSKRELSVYTNGTFEIISLNKREFNKKIEEITNLNFDRFTKTVMLAQGSFDSFLQAKDNDKSDLLEKITGTQIYQKISKRVFEREKEQREKLLQLSAKIDNSKILQDEEIKEKELEIDRAKEESSKLKKEIKELQDIIKIAENISKYQERLKSLEEDKKEIDKKDKLEDIDSAKELVLKQENIEKVLDLNQKELKQKKKKLSKYLKDIEKDTKEKSKLEESLKEIIETLFEKPKKNLQIYLTELEKKVNQIDDKRLFEDKYKLEKQIESIKNYEKLQKDKSTQDKRVQEYKSKQQIQYKIVANKYKEIEKLISKIKKLEELKLSAQLIQNYEEARKNLKDNEECPLCGSKSHPYIINMPQFDNSISIDLDNCENSLKALKEELKQDETILKKIDTSIEVANTKLQNIIDNLAKLNIDENEKIKDIEIKLKEINNSINNNKFLRKKYNKARELESNINLLKNNISNKNEQTNAIKEDIQRVEKKIEEENNQLQKIKSDILNLLKPLIEKGFNNRDEIKDIIEKQEAIKKRKLEIETLLNSTKESLDNELKKDIPIDKSVEELKREEITLSDNRDEVNKKITLIQKELKDNKIIKKEQESILREIDTQKELLAPWKILNDLIGSSNGAKYQKFVQNLTLGHLLNLANRHLCYLSDRYRLIKTDNNKLDISIIDGYFLNKQRGINTLSGGERFLVSLALALGLSDLVNDKIKVDSLFLDEGFGTLDEDSLDIAITALEKLHAKGKLIGVISHVALLKERISTQIEIKKRSGGDSDIKIAIN